MNRTVHTLVAETFIGPRPEGQQVRHLDGVRWNNNAWNLEYGTAVQNASDRNYHGNTKRGENNGNSRLSDDAADEIRTIYASRRISQRQLARRFSISQAQVNNIVQGKQRQRMAA